MKRILWQAIENVLYYYFDFSDEEVETFKTALLSELKKLKQ
jgi:hypothetical protein